MTEVTPHPDYVLATAFTDTADDRSVSPLAAEMLWTPPVTTGPISWQVSDHDDVEWICTDLAGWAGLPKSTARFGPRQFDHGAWGGPGFFTAREIAFTGWIVAPDRFLLQAALHRLRSMYVEALTQTSVLSVGELDGTKRLGVLAAEDDVTVTYRTPNAALVEFGLVAPWPIKNGEPKEGSAAGQTGGVGRTYPRPDEHGWWAYGEAGSSGNLHAVNAGNAPVRPTFTITGPVENPRIIHQGQRRSIGFAITLSGTDELTIDADTHATLLNSSANRRYLLAPDSAWFDILPGDNVLQYRSDDNGGRMTVRWSDGWW